MTLDRLAEQLSPRMVVYEMVCVGLVALSMFILWDDPGSPWGTVIVLAVSFVVIGKVWMMPSRELPRVPLARLPHLGPRARRAFATVAGADGFPPPPAPPAVMPATARRTRAAERPVPARRPPLPADGSGRR